MKLQALAALVNLRPGVKTITNKMQLFTDYYGLVFSGLRSVRTPKKLNKREYNLLSTQGITYKNITIKSSHDSLMISNVTLLQKNFYINPLQWNVIGIRHFKMLTQHFVTCKIGAFKLGYIDTCGN